MEVNKLGTYKMRNGELAEITDLDGAAPWKIHGKTTEGVLDLWTTTGTWHAHGKSDYDLIEFIEDDTQLIKSLVIQEPSTPLSVLMDNLKASNINDEPGVSIEEHNKLAAHIHEESEYLSNFRDQVAMEVLNIFLSNSKTKPSLLHEMTDYCYAVADSMIQSRKG